MPQLPTSHPTERRASHKWIWLSLLGLVLLCAAAIHRRHLPFQRAKDLSGYNIMYSTPANETFEELRDMDDGDLGEDGDMGEDDDADIPLADEHGAINDDAPALGRRHGGSRIFSKVEGGHSA